MVALSLHGILRHRPIDNVRKPHEEMVAKMAPGDQLWVTSMATPCFLYYSRQYPLPHGVSVHLLGLAERPVLPSGRNWFLVMRTPWEPGEGEALLAYGAESGGKEESSFDVEWTTARLFAIPRTRRDRITYGAESGRGFDRSMGKDSGRYFNEKQRSLVPGARKSGVKG